MKNIFRKILLIGLTILSTVSFANNFTPQEYLLKSDKWLRNNFDSAIVYSDKAISVAASNDFIVLIHAYKNLGLANDRLKNNSLALLNYQKAIKIAEEHKLFKEQFFLFNSLGTYYKKQNSLKPALESFQKESDLAKQIKDPSLIAMSLNDIGSVYGLQNNYEGAIENYTRALAIYKSISDSSGLGYSLTYLGEIYTNKKQFDPAFYSLQTALGIHQRMNDSLGMIISLNIIAEMYLLKNNYNYAIIYNLKSLELLKLLNDTDLILQRYKRISEIYRSQKNFEQAYNYYKLYVTVNDSIYDQRIILLKKEKELMYQNELKQFQIDNQKKENTMKQLTLEKQANDKKIFLCIIAALIIVIIILLILVYRNKQKPVKIATSQKPEIEIKNEPIQAKVSKDEDSVNYSERVQQSLLASNSLLKANLQEHFVLYKPKNIGGGDFYWASQQGSKFYLCVAESKEYVVDSAFSSLLNISFLNNTISERKIESPDKILNEVRNEFITYLNSESREEPKKDGMDAVLCMFDLKGMWLRFSAANIPLRLIRNNELKIFAADKTSVGMTDGEQISFSLQTIGLRKGDIVYLFTDGLSDQFEGENGNKKLEDLLFDNRERSMEEQKGILDRSIEAQLANVEQKDDILIVGIKV